VSTYLSFIFVSSAGDPLANLRQNPKVSQNTLNLEIHKNHLDQNIFLRYFTWIWDVIQHGFGRSLLNSLELWPQITRTFGHTAEVVILAEVIAIIIGCAVGMYSAIRQYSFFDYSFTTLSFLGFAMPTFFLALILQTLFVDQYNGSFHILAGKRIFYTFGINNPGASDSWFTWDRLQHIGLPVMTLATISFALYSRYMRASMLDVINSDYVRTARAKGVPEWKVIIRHVVPNALIPVVTVTALNLGGILGGAIVTETVFTLDGFGSWFVEALTNGDMYAVMSYLVITAGIIILFNLIADILYGVLDPRIRYE
jgi:peptide/nickel transport system permease protein